MASWDADGEDGMMGRWQSWMPWIRYEGYYDRAPEDRVTRAEWAGGFLLFVVMCALLYSGIFGCAWIDVHAPWLAGR